MKTVLQSALIVLFLLKLPCFFVNAQDVGQDVIAKQARASNPHREWNERNFREVAKEVSGVQAGGAEATIGVVSVLFRKGDAIGNSDLLFLGNVRSTLQELSICSLEIDPRAFTTLETLKNLSTLALETPVVDDRIFKEIAKIERLEHLSLNISSVTGEGLSSIAHLRLKQLALSETRLNRAGMNALGLFPSLKILRLNNTEVDDNALEVISRLTKLEELSLYGTKIKNIQNLTGTNKDLPELERLNIGGTQVNDTIIDHLKWIPKLYSLNVQSTNVTLQGLAKLVDYKNDLAFFGSLSVTPDQMDDPTAKKLKDAFPNLTIHFEPRKK